MIALKISCFIFPPTVCHDQNVRFPDRLLLYPGAHWSGKPAGQSWLDEACYWLSSCSLNMSANSGEVR